MRYGFVILAFILFIIAGITYDTLLAFLGCGCLLFAIFIVLNNISFYFEIDEDENEDGDDDES